MFKFSPDVPQTKDGEGCECIKWKSLEDWNAQLYWLGKGDKTTRLHLTEEVNDQPAVGDPPILLVKERPPERRLEDDPGLGWEAPGVRIRVPEVEYHGFPLALGMRTGKDAE